MHNCAGEGGREGGREGNIQMLHSTYFSVKTTAKLRNFVTAPSVDNLHPSEMP